MIGVNVQPHEPKQLKEIMEKENMNWRSTADHGAIAPKFNSPGTPVYYVIDPAGVIQHKWIGNPGPRAMDEALEKLISNAAE